LALVGCGTRSYQTPASRQDYTRLAVVGPVIPARSPRKRHFDVSAWPDSIRRVNLLTHFSAGELRRTWLGCANTSAPLGDHRTNVRVAGWETDWDLAALKPRVDGFEADLLIDAYTYPSVIELCPEGRDVSWHRVVNSTFALDIGVRLERATEKQRRTERLIRRQVGANRTLATDEDIDGWLHDVSKLWDTTNNLSSRASSVDATTLTARVWNVQDELHRWRNSVAVPGDPNLEFLMLASHPEGAPAAYEWLRWLQTQTAFLGFLVSAREREDVRAWVAWEWLGHSALIAAIEPQAVPGRRPQTELLPRQIHERALPRETRAGPTPRTASSSDEDAPPRSTAVLVEP
jgi:hypothetical protein